MGTNAVHAQDEYEPFIVMSSVTQATIADHCHTIERMLFKKALVKAVVMAGATISSLFYGYKWLTFFIDSKQAMSGQAVEVTTHHKDAQLMEPASESKSFDGYAMAGSFTEYVLCRVACFLLISYIGDYAFHPGTLFWYIKNYAPYKKTVALLKEYAKLAHLERVSAGNSSLLVFYRQSLQTLAQELVEQCAMICAYIQYKSQEEKERKRQQCMAIMQHIIEQVNNWIERIQLIDFKNCDAYAQFETELQQLVEVITREIAHAVLYRV